MMLQPGPPIASGYAVQPGSFRLGQAVGPGYATMVPMSVRPAPHVAMVPWSARPAPPVAIAPQLVHPPPVQDRHHVVERTHVRDRPVLSHYRAVEQDTPVVQVTTNVREARYDSDFPYHDPAFGCGWRYHYPDTIDEEVRNFAFLEDTPLDALLQRSLANLVDNGWEPSGQQARVPGGAYFSPAVQAGPGVGLGIPRVVEEVRSPVVWLSQGQPVVSSKRPSSLASIPRYFSDQSSLAAPFDNSNWADAYDTGSRAGTLDTNSVR